MKRLLDPKKDVPILEQVRDIVLSEASLTYDESSYANYFAWLIDKFTDDTSRHIYIACDFADDGQVLSMFVGTSINLCWNRSDQLVLPIWVAGFSYRNKATFYTMNLVDFMRDQTDLSDIVSAEFMRLGYYTAYTVVRAFKSPKFIRRMADNMTNHTMLVEARINTQEELTAYKNKYSGFFWILPNTFKQPLMLLTYHTRPELRTFISE